ncbi:MAG: lipoyl synthase [Planctomycetota bacterium]
MLSTPPRPTDFVKKGKPRWLRMQMPQSDKYFDLRNLVNDNNLHTVCQEARCPNIGECWSQGVGTLMILGDTCTRSCGFCNIKTGKPPVLDTDEPARVGAAVATMGLNFVCITSVNRDELPDGGAEIWAETIREIRRQAPRTKVEALIPDFCGDWDALQTVLDAGPDILNHNLESVPRIYPAVRPQARYDRSLELLRRAKEQGFLTKTGIMVGIGETDDEVDQLMDDIVEHTRTDNGSCDILSIGQYLQPTPNHLPVNRFVHPDRFAKYKEDGEAKGIRHVESGPMVRSSYHADQQAELDA